jgi:hypothetical protein
MRIFTLLLLIINAAHADRIANYMNIANNIPKMEIKADIKAQTWARSARHVLNITDESIAETLLEMNKLASQKGRPIFCMNNEQTLDTKTLDGIIRQTYTELDRIDDKAGQMTVSQIAIAGLIKKYPCNKSIRDTQLEHAASLIGAGARIKVATTR